MRSAKPKRLNSKKNVNTRYAYYTIWTYCRKKARKIQSFWVSFRNEIDCGATLPSCTIALILLAQYKTRPIIPKKLYFCLLHLFSLFLLDARTRQLLWNRLKNHRELWNILIRLLLFVKFIHEYAHHAWNPSLRSWRYCKIKVLAAEPRSQKRSRDGYAVKSYSTILQRLRRQMSLDYYTIPPASRPGILGNQNWKNVRQHQTQSST